MEVVGSSCNLSLTQQDPTPSRSPGSLGLDMTAVLAMSDVLRKDRHMSIDEYAFSACLIASFLNVDVGFLPTPTGAKSTMRCVRSHILTTIIPECPPLGC